MHAPLTTTVPAPETPHTMTASLEQFRGSLLGLALGDAFGAPREGGPVERLVWRLIGKTKAGEMRWTDDTQMSLDLAESLIEHGTLDRDDLATRFAKSYRWSRGYGPGAAKVLKRIRRGTPWLEASRSVYPDGSFGNGGAMRAPVVGLFFARVPEQLTNAAEDAARLTHAHALGLEGAVLIATATSAATTSSAPLDIFRLAAGSCEQPAFVARLAVAREWLTSGKQSSPADVRVHLGNGIAALDSCVTALYVAMRFLGNSFEELLAFVAACRGDVDTIGAMSGAIWGAVNGSTKLPETLLARLEQRARIEQTAAALHRRSATSHYARHGKPTS